MMSMLIATFERSYGIRKLELTKHIRYVCMNVCVCVFNPLVEI